MEYTFYRIYSKNPAITECYIGSTEDLHQRKIQHKSDCNNINYPGYNIKVYQYIRSNGGFDQFEFEIIDTIIFSETDRLLHENKLMDLYGSTLNTKRAIITKEKKEYDKEYYETHREERKKYKKEHYETHKEKINEYQKEYNETHKDKIKEYQKEHKKEYYKNHKEQLNKKIICEICGGKYTYVSKSKHLKTKKHISQINL
jgi:hypothetical protein